MKDKKESHPEIDWLKNPSTFAKIQITKFIFMLLYYFAAGDYMSEIGAIRFFILLIYFEIIWITIELSDNRSEK